VLSAFFSRIASGLLVFADVTDMIDFCGLQICFSHADIGNRSLGNDIGRDVVNAAIFDFVNEADIPVFAGRYTRDYFPPGYLRIDDRFASASSVVNHHDEILHVSIPRRARATGWLGHVIFLKIRKMSNNISEKQKNWL
jgi:hypothetical protein